MKFNFDKRYLKLCKYIGVTTILIYMAFRLIDSVPFLYDYIINFFVGFKEICFPIILGFIIAFLMFGPSSAIEKLLLKTKPLSKRKSLCRGLGILFSYLVVFSIFIAIICGLYFMIGGQISQNSTINNIMVSITNYFETNTLSSDTFTHLVEKMHLPFGDLITLQMGNIANFLQESFTDLLNGLTSFLFDLGSNLFSLLIAITLSIYVIASYEYFDDLWDKFFYIVFRKRKSGTIIRRSLHIINVTFSRYIRGQVIEASIVALLSTTVLTVIGVDYAIVIGIICGIFNLIPYIGPFIGIVIAAILALLSGELWLVVGTIVGLFIVQQIDVNFLCPKIVGDIVGLHPALVLIAVTVGGNWYGLLGMIIAVPIAASLKTLIKDWYEHYIEDSYKNYTSTTDVDASAEKPVFDDLDEDSTAAATDSSDNTTSAEGGSDTL